LIREDGTSFLFHGRLLSSFGRVHFRDGIKQNLSIRVQRPAKEILSVGDLHNLSHIHHSNSIADMFDDPKVMGDKNIGEAQLISQVHQEI
jgi:hypothetical protein